MKIQYKHLSQRPHLCAATCLQMVLFRKGHWVEQEELAFKMGTRIRTISKDLFNLSFKIDDNDAGVRLEEFSKFDWLSEYGLKAEVITFNEIKDFKELIEENLNNDNDIIVNFHRSVFTPERDWGHFALISSIEDKEVELCSSSYIEKPFYKVNIDKLLEAVSYSKNGESRGVVIIKKL